MTSFKGFFMVVLFALALVPSYATESSPDELYWKLKLGNIVMPTVLKCSLQLGSSDKIVEVLRQFNEVEKNIDVPLQDTWVNYWYKYTNPGQPEFANGNQMKKDSPVQFLTHEKLSTIGATLKLYFNKVDNGRKFLPLYITKSMDMASNKLEAILKILSLNIKSKEAKYIAQMLKDCERKDLRDEVILCVSSLKDMVDFVISSSNSTKSNFMVVTTKEERHNIMEYTIQKTQKVGNDDNHTTVCHRMNNPYVVFLCHNIRSIDVYKVSLLGANRNQVNAIAVCHKDTSKWNRDHIAFQFLKLEPGSGPICHILSGDVVVWLLNEKT